MNRRGQIAVTPVIPMMVVTISALIVILVANEVTTAYSAELANSSENVTTVCAGFAGGCDGGSAFGLLPVFGLVVIVAIVVSVPLSLKSRSESRKRSKTSNIDFLKEQYLRGNITEGELEAKLEWYIDPGIDDGEDSIDRQLQQGDGGDEQ